MYKEFTIDDLSLIGIEDCGITSFIHNGEEWFNIGTKDSPCYTRMGGLIEFDKAMCEYANKLINESKTMNYEY